MSNTAYSERLKDPRWQRKRLEILNREDFKCQCCGDGNSTLHVHHLIYSNSDPWDVPSDHLECLCEDCHQWREDFNEFAGGRTLMPTIVCFCFCRISSGAVGWPVRWSALPLVRFCKYVSYMSPENVPESWRPKPEAVEQCSAGSTT